MDSRSDESDVVGVVSEFDDDTYLCFVCRERGKECESSTCVCTKIIFMNVLYVRKT